MIEYTVDYGSLRNMAFKPNDDGSCDMIGIVDVTDKDDKIHVAGIYIPKMKIDSPIVLTQKDLDELKSKKTIFEIFVEDDNQ